MLYLGIDQHARQLTISLRNDDGDVIQARQVSTRPDKVQEFFTKLTRERLGSGESFIAVLEVCGFNDWLIRLLRDYRCQQVILIQPEERKQRKTDRRDAAALSELLWVNRDRLLAGKPVRGLRQIVLPSPTDQENRRLTTLRKEASQVQTRLVNKIKHLLRRHNLQWDLPTKTFPTRRAIRWLQELVLPAIDRLEMDYLLVDLEQAQRRVQELETVIVERCGNSQNANLLRSMPGVSYFTATSLACRVGRIQRFPRAQSLANYWGLTPGCRNSGENSQRLGRITKAGSNIARWLLAQVAHQALRKDARLREWYKRIRRRRGSTIARVAVMRKLATVIWKMLSKQQTYAECRAVALAGQENCKVVSFDPWTAGLRSGVVPGGLFSLWKEPQMQSLSLLSALKQLEDPRDPRGVRHPFSGVVALALLGMLARIREMEVLVRWATTHWEQLREPLGFGRDAPPVATTISRTLALCMVADLQAVFLRWLRTCGQELPDEGVVAVDGKTAKQALDDGRPLHMLNAFVHQVQITVGQWSVGAEKSNEPTVLRRRLEELIANYPLLKLLTGDALFAQRPLAELLTGRGIDYLFQIEANQGDTLDALENCFAHPCRAATCCRNGQ